MTEQPIVYIVDDDDAMTESLAWIIGSVGLKTKLFSSAQDFLDAYNPEVPGCLLLDIRMPEMSGPELQEKLLRKYQTKTLPIIFISGHGDIPLAVRVIKSGAIDFLSKPFNDEVLLETVNKAIRLDKEHRKQEEKSTEIIERALSLTPREHQVMCRIVAGKLNKVISAELNISLKTVEAHRASVMKKLKVRSLPELVKISLINNLCEPRKYSTEPDKMEHFRETIE